MIHGVKIEKDPQIDKLAADVFSKLNKIANPEGKKEKPSGLVSLSMEEALKELLEMKKKLTS